MPFDKKGAGNLRQAITPARKWKGPYYESYRRDRRDEIS